MKIAIIARQQDALSLRIYQENVIRELMSLDMVILPFPEAGPIPMDCDLVWDPGLGMRKAPEILINSRVPVVGTMHGVRVFSLSIRECANTWKGRIQEYSTKRLIARDWRWFRKVVSGVITPSQFGSDEAIRAFALSPHKVHAIYHGVNLELFSPKSLTLGKERPYLLHVSSFQPKKNVNRILTAYNSIPLQSRPELVLVVPGYNGNIGIRKVSVIRKELSHPELAQLYRGALGFLFPSLHETFGMPILEAMACGCPVITSNITACPEIAGDAALLVNPRSVNSIANAIHQLVEDKSLRENLRQKGLEHVKRFTWQKSAMAHLKVFKSCLKL